MTSKYALKYETPRRPITIEDVAFITDSLTALAEERKLYAERQKAALPTTEVIEIIPAVVEHDTLALSALYHALPIGNYEREA